MIGAESGSQEALDYINKDMKAEDNFKLAELSKKYGIKVDFSFMFGFPRSENFSMPLEKEFLMTMEAIKKIYEINDNMHLMWFMYTPYPGTSLYEISKQSGFQEPKSLEDWSKFNILEQNMPWVDKKYFEHLKQLNTYIFPCAARNYFKLGYMLSDRFGIFKPFSILLLRMLHELAKFRLKNTFLIFPVEHKIIEFAKRTKIYEKTHLPTDMIPEEKRLSC